MADWISRYLVNTIGLRYSMEIRHGTGVTMMTTAAKTVDWLVLSEM